MNRSFPVLTDFIIRGRTSSQSYARGYDYFHNGAMQNVAWCSGVLTAEVQGSDDNPYQVRVVFRDNQIQEASCSCPYDWGGDCKHIVAVLLTLLNTPDVIEIHPPLEQLLASLNADQLRTLLFDVAEYAPQVLNYLEERVALMGAAGPQDSTAPRTAAPFGTPLPPTFDAASLKRQIKTDIRNIARTTDAYDESYDDLDLTEALEPAVTLAQKYLAANDATGALEVLEAAAEAFQEATDNLDEYILETQEESVYEQMLSFAAIWAEAFLSATWTREQKIYWLEELEEFIENMFGGEALMMAQTALQQGWTYPPLVAAMCGESGEHGAWENEAPDYADELAEVRLRILEKRGDWDSFFNLAKAEGQITRYLQALLKLGRNQQALDEARCLLTDPDLIYQIARNFAEAGDVAHAIELGRYGLTRAQSYNVINLATWLREYAAAQGDSDLALQAAQTAFRASISLSNYLALKQQAGTLWETLKPQALEIVAAYQGASTEKIEIYLHEKMYSELIALVDSHFLWYYDWFKIVHAVQYEFPEWAIERSKQHAERIMNAAKSDEYAAAVGWLKTVRDILLRMDRKQEWQTYFSEVKQTHARKYKLMGLLKEL